MVRGETDKKTNDLQTRHFVAVLSLFPMSGPAVKNHGWPSKGSRSFARRKISYLLLSWIVVEVWYQFVFYIATAGLGLVHFQVQQQSDVTMVHQETGEIHQIPRTKIWKGDYNRASDDRLGDLPEWFKGVHRKSQRYRGACNRTHFSCLRFGTAYKSGTQEAPYF